MPRTTPAPSESRTRSRGLKGREEASERSIITGNGSQGGITDGGRGVLLSGLPGKITTDAVRRYLKNYKLMGGQAEVVKLERSAFPSFVVALGCSFTPVGSRSQGFQWRDDRSSTCPAFLTIRSFQAFAESAHDEL